MQAFDSSNDRPMVSAVIPTFNRAHLIERAIRSVEAQSYRPLELVIVDDGSTDNTAALVEGLSLSIPVKLIRQPENRGGAAARNVGIKTAQGEYIGFLDSDDTWQATKIEKQVARLISLGSRYGVCYTGLQQFDEKNRLLTTLRPEISCDVSTSLIRRNCIGTFSTTLVRKSLLEDVGGLAEHLRSCQDWDLWLRLSRITQFASLQEPLTNYSVTLTGRISNRPRDRLSGHLYIYRRHLRDTLIKNTELRREFYLIIGDILMQLGKPKSALPFLVESVKNNPLSTERVAMVVMALLRTDPRAYQESRRQISRISHAVHRLELRRRFCSRFRWLA